MNSVKNFLAARLRLPLASLLNAVDAPSDDRAPSVLSILADDWGWGDLSCHGHPYVKTPHMSHATVDRHWKLATRKDASYSELYDLAADPHEPKDLKGENPEVGERLLSKIADWQRTLPSKPNPAFVSAGRSKQFTL